jgi:hypothetical protein
MTLRIELPDDKTAALAAKARTQGLAAEQYAREVLERDLESEPEAPAEEPLRTAADIILSNMSRVSAEDMATLPRYGASQHDH